MAGLSGLIGGILSGYREGNHDFQVDTEFKDSRKRAAKQDARMDVQDARTAQDWENRQDDRSHELERRPVLEARQDDQAGMAKVAAEQGITLGQHKIDRMPIEDQQADTRSQLSNEATRVGMQATRQSMANAAQDQARQEKLGQIQQQLAQWGYDDTKIQRDIRDSQQVMAKAIGKYQAGGDLSVLRDGFNESVGKATGQSVESIEQTGKGGPIKVKMNGGREIEVKNEDELFNLAANALSPESHMMNLYNHIESRFGGQPGGNHDVPAAIQEVNQVYARLPRQDGEDDAGRWMRAYKMTNDKAGASPSDAIGKFYAAIVTEGAKSGIGKPDEIKDQALKATRDFAAMFYPDFKMPGGPGPVGAGQPGAAPAAGATGAPGAAPFREGQRIKDKAGREYIVKNGQPVPVQ